MKIYIPERAKQGDIGGGFTFTRNIIKALNKKVQFVDNWQDCDIYFIPGPTLTQRDEVNEAKRQGKKVVFRIDNIPRNSRNRNTGTSRLYDFAQVADEVIYQSKWAKDLLMPFTKKYGGVILNGADTDIFTPQGDKFEKDGSPQYLYSRINRDEIKRWEKAYYDFQQAYFKNPKAHLWIVGKFSPQNLEYHFDFFGGAEKRYKYWGSIRDPKEMAKIYRSIDKLLLPYFADACSNTLIEAVLCGVIDIEFDFEGGGGSSEILRTSRKELTLEAMGEKYYATFKRILGT